jgi:ACS family hexuronate transporter-like MFS transporter
MDTDVSGKTGRYRWLVICTLVSDTMPRECISSVVGIGGMAGSIGGMLIAKVAGYVLEWTGSYQPMFIIASSAYLIALAVIQILVPQLRPAEAGD